MVVFPYIGTMGKIPFSLSDSTRFDSYKIKVENMLEANWGERERAPTLLMSMAIVYVLPSLHVSTSDRQTAHAPNPDIAYF